jgi:hypothetical protein
MMQCRERQKGANSSHLAGLLPPENMTLRQQMILARLRTSSGMARPSASAVAMAVCEAKLDRRASTLNEAGLVQPLANGPNSCALGFPGLAAEESDHRHRRLLRSCHERPCRRRAAEQRYELAAFHCLVPPVLAADEHLASGINAVDLED